MGKFRSQHYFKGGADADWCSEGAIDPWPQALESIAERDLAISALGALACHLTRLKVRSPNSFTSGHVIVSEHDCCLTEKTLNNNGLTLYS